MRPDQERAALKRLLDLCQEVEQVTEALGTGGGTGPRRRQRTRRRQLLRTLQDLMTPGGAESHLPSMLLAVADDHDLGVQDLMLIAFLLSRRIAGSDPVMEGRELLQLFSESSCDLLENGALLHGDGRLVASHLVQAQLPHPDAALEGEFRIAERFFRRIYRDFHGRTTRRVEPPPPYGSAIDHYRDLRHLVSLYQKRAAATFPLSYWVDVYADVNERPEDLTEAAARVREIITTRESLTDGVVLPLLGIREEFKLEESEEIILLVLLMQELYASSPLLEAAELIRLVSTNHDEVFRRRTLLSPRGRLQESGLVAFDTELEDKELLAGTYLPEWVVDRLLDTGGPSSGIQKDEQIRFHDYLQGLDSSEDFYRKL